MCLCIYNYKYNEALAESICESVCMIVVFSQLYPQRPYCLREYFAMERVEAQLKQELQAHGNSYDRKCGMIIPIILAHTLEQLHRIQQIICYPVRPRIQNY